MRCSGLAQSGKVAFNIGQKDRYAEIREALGKALP